MTYIYSFILGGVITTAIVYFEASGMTLVSRLAALFPVFTWLSYLFIGELQGPQAVSRHSLFVLLGTIVAWLPYMVIIWLLAPRIGSGKAIGVAILAFLVLATVFVKLYKGA